MAAARKSTATKAGDFTGRQRDELIKKNAEELAEKANQVSMATAAKAKEFAEGVHDPRHPESVTIVDEVEDLGVQTNEAAMVEIRVNEDIDSMTYGYGNTYTMQAGARYRVPKAVADHLERKGLVWH